MFYFDLFCMLCLKSSGPKTNNDLTNAQFEKQIADLRSELNSKNKIIEQLIAEKRNELQRTKELEIIIDQQQEKIQLLENDGRGHSRSGSGRDFSNSPEYSDLSKTIQRQSHMIKELQEDIKTKEKIIAKQNEMLHLAELLQFESKSANKINGHHIENGTYRADEIKLTNIDEITNSDDNRGNDRNDVLLKNNCLIISDEAILIFLLFTFSNFITVG